VNGCIFCNPPEDRVFLQNHLAYVLWDGFPVTRLHSLVMPRRHAEDYFSLTREELIACDDLLRKASEALRTDDAFIKGFNIGVNVGSVAGQTIFHCHFHLIPRRTGDVENPRGGVRHLIPGKGDY
jgi:diadenosine tetraphosphate (Ap4A) HIT family hydrolase